MEGQSDKRVYPVAAVDYKLLEEVGQGVSATVYRAICLPYNEVVAIKSLDLEKCSSNLDEIRREAQTMSLISHSNVVKACCSFVVDHSLWVVMPYLAGGSCLHLMKAAYPDGFEEPVIATVLKESLKALEYLHRHGLIHRDVKAGNILVDGNGVVKLGDFGVSACMFDTGDRQRSRNTFVGTPCWMAPEVMEQVHGYDFKADIWSFGITALELAHGHAPFSKYPPMKVLLMTLQNAPPGLDYERDKRFSKSFKEMIAMCLVKDPARRPSAEKLLKHSFFKNARSYEYLARHLLDGLPPLGERVKNLKLKDAARLAQKKMPYGEQEERSQNEYKRGVSCWNFNLEDLKAQAALIQDDDNCRMMSVQEDEQFKQQPWKEGGAPLKKVNSEIINRQVCTPPDEDSHQLSLPSQPHRAEAPADGSDRLMGWSSNSPTVGEEDKDSDREKNHREVVGVVEDAVRSTMTLRDKALTGPSLVTVSSERNLQEHLVMNGAVAGSRCSSAHKDGVGEKVRAPVVQKKGRFSVTSEESEPERKGQPSSQFGATTSATVPTGVVLPHLHSLLQQATIQQDLIMNLISGINSGDIPNAPRPGYSISRSHSRSADISNADNVGELSSERDRDLHQLVVQLQSKIADLVDELHVVKLRNSQLERQLNPVHSKEEQRIHKEEAPKENG